MNHVAGMKEGVTRERWERAMREKPFDGLRQVKLLETLPEDFAAALTTGLSRRTFSFAGYTISLWT
jgi:hypothetical protein